jgi:tetratricopeptide (TPR) repeat protein
MTNTLSALQQLAINAAKRQEWEAAVTINTDILAQYPEDLGALNRLGVAHLNTGNKSAAKKAFDQVLKLDKSNSIAKKHLDKLKHNQNHTVVAFSNEHFIEEPGKTKTVELHRLAGKNVLEKLAVGESCELKLKNRYISVERQDGTYVGALPEDLSLRLANLVKTGNTYACFIQSLSMNSCTVYLKELTRSEKNTHVNSFPINKSSMAAINDVDEQFLFEDNIPVQVSDDESTEVDVDKSLNDFESDRE